MSERTLTELARAVTLKLESAEAVEAQSTISDLRAEAERFRPAGEEKLAIERTRYKMLEEAKEGNSLDAQKAFDHVQSKLKVYGSQMEQELLQERTRTHELLQTQSEDIHLLRCRKSCREHVLQRKQRQMQKRQSSFSRSRIWNSSGLHRKTGHGS